MEEINIKRKLDFVKFVLLGCVTNQKVIDDFFSEGKVPDSDTLNSVLTIPESRIEGRDEPERGYTMIGLKRMENLHEMLEYVRKNNIKGDLVETGVWRGGATIYMRYYSKIYGMNKNVIVCDSFKGLPIPSGKFEADNGDLHHTYPSLSVSLTDVKEYFSRFGCLDDSVIFIEGFFGDVLPDNESIKDIALLRLDGDMYESTHDVFYNLYDKVSDNAPVIVDDYCLDGCRKCVNDFRAHKNIEKPIESIDRCGIYWYK